MSDFSKEFLLAFNHAMIYEVGPFWDPTDPEVQQGLCDTKDQRRKTGYVNIPADTGGETKYGVAKSANPDVDIRLMDLQTAMSIYCSRYWDPARCADITSPVVISYFDACVNHGLPRGAKLLQQAAGTAVDGSIGPGTLSAVAVADPVQLVNNFSKLRSDFYYAIVNRNPTQTMFLDGWLKRNKDVIAYTLSQIA